MFGTLAFVHNLFQEDDEEDFETGVRKYFGEGMYGGLGNFVLGVDVAGRMGLSNLVFRDRLIEKDQSILWTVGEMFGGPVIGYGLQVERGLNLIADDELARGIEAMSPAALRNVIKAVRFSSDGAKNLRGIRLLRTFTEAICSHRQSVLPPQHTRSSYRKIQPKQK